jgi:glutamate--cysteine ligase
VPMLGFGAEIRGITVRELARQTLALAREGLTRRGRKDRDGLDETQYLAPLEESAERGITPAEELLQKFHGSWNGSVEPIFSEYAY